MKKNPLIILILFFTMPFVQAQKKDIATIKHKYNTLKNDIAELKTASYTGKYYCFEINDNIYGKYYPGVGEYTAKIRIYYSLNGMTQEFYPVMVIVDEKRAGKMKTYKEFLFEEQNLLFAFIKDAYNENIEQRFYCHENTVFYYTENNNVKSTTDTQWIFDKAQNYLTVFNAVK